MALPSCFSHRNHASSKLANSQQLVGNMEKRPNANRCGGFRRNAFESAVAECATSCARLGVPPFESYILAENKKGPPFGEPFLILRMVRHHTNGCWPGGPDFRGTGIGRFSDVPHRVSINKSASYGFRWNRIRNCGGSSECSRSIAIKANNLRSDRDIVRVFCKWQRFWIISSALRTATAKTLNVFVLGRLSAS